MIKLLLTIGDVSTDEFALTTPRISIGRNVDSDIVLDDPLVSGRHALIIVSDGNRAPLLQDLHSTNGTRVNGRDVRNAALKHGDEIQIGRCVFRVHDDGNRTPTASQN